MCCWLVSFSGDVVLLSIFVAASSIMLFILLDLELQLCRPSSNSTRGRMFIFETKAQMFVAVIEWSTRFGDGSTSVNLN